MDFRSRLLAPCAIRKEGSDIEVDFLAGEFLERLILFDKFILDSIRLREIPHLVRLFGDEPILELLKSGMLLIHSETFLGFGSTGQTSLDLRVKHLGYWHREQKRAIFHFVRTVLIH